MTAIKSEISDIEEIFRLYKIATALMRDKGVRPWPEFDREMLVTELMDGRQWKFVLDGQIACVWAITYSDPEIWGDRNKDPSVYIHRIAANPNFRGKGMLAHIVDWAIDHARSRNLQYIRMDTVGENLGLIAHYTKHGFSFLGLSKLENTSKLPAHYHDATVSLFQIEVTNRSRDLFEPKANSYEQTKSRVDNVDNIANAIISSTSLFKPMQLMDFGSGTGLLLERVAAYVGKITAIDISSSMNQQLEYKRERLNCELEILEIDLETNEISASFDGIISSMTMHHVKDVEAMFKKFYNLLNDGGFIAIADLDKEDGSFHTEDTGVFHFGFDRKEIEHIALATGFQEVSVTDASVISKPQGEFSVFILKATRKG